METNIFKGQNGTQEVFLLLFPELGSQGWDGKVHKGLELHFSFIVCIIYRMI